MVKAYFEPWAWQNEVWIQNSCRFYTKLTSLGLIDLWNCFVHWKNNNPNQD
jgi:hypothetical protein